MVYKIIAGAKTVFRHKKGVTYVAVWSPEMTEQQIKHDIAHGMPFYPYDEKTGETDWSQSGKGLTFKR